MFKTVAQVAQEVGCSKFKGGRREAQALPWAEWSTSIAVAAWRHNAPNGRQVIDAFCCKFSRQSGRCFCLLCRWSSYTETGFSGVRRPLSWPFFGRSKVAQRDPTERDKGISPVAIRHLIRDMPIYESCHQGAVPALICPRGGDKTPCTGRNRESGPYKELSHLT